MLRFSLLAAMALLVAQWVEDARSVRAAPKDAPAVSVKGAQGSTVDQGKASEASGNAAKLAEKTSRPATTNSPSDSSSVDGSYEYDTPKKPGKVKLNRKPSPNGFVAATRLRQPTAMMVADNGKRLLVANRRSGSVSVVSTVEDHVVVEHDLGKQLADLVPIPLAQADVAGGVQWLLAVDEGANELLLIRRSMDALSVVQRLPVSANPVSVATSANGKFAYVASLWSRRWTKIAVQLDAAVPKLSIEQVTDLPYAPRKQLVVTSPQGPRVIAADAFGGKLGIIDAADGKLLYTRELPAHNIRGLAIAPNGTQVLVSHQIINSLAETSANDVHWGVLMTNVLRWLVLDNVLDPKAEILRRSHVHPPGETNDAGGDPAGVFVTPAGVAVMGLAGVDQIAFGTSDDVNLRRVAVGRAPTNVVVLPDGRAYAANSLDDTLSIVDLKTAEVTDTLPLGPRPQLTPVDQGERLFYNARLSMDGWFSCHSCHTDGHSNGTLVDNSSDGSFGTAKRVLTLLGTRDVRPWAWNGGAETLEEQIETSVHNTMQGGGISTADVAALAAYLKTLSPPPSLTRMRGTVDEAAVARGRGVFEGNHCNNCHRQPLYTSAETFDVGLVDQKGMRRFNPPSLRGVSQGGPYFHDNRAATLEEIFVKHRHQLTGELKPNELRDLVEFLKSL